MHAVKLNHLCLLAIAAVVLVLGGCGASEGGHDIANLGGTWQNPTNHEKVVINVTGEKKTITMADKTMPLKVKPTQADRFIFEVSDSASGQKEWKVFRVWDDEGKSFTLEIDHDGKKENLERAKG